MNVIYKYPVGLLELQHVRMPEGARILKIAEQNTEFFIWAMVDNSNPVVNYCIRVYGTGHPILINPEYLTHIDTVISGSFVWHFFLNSV